jgi:hypothetical protein
MRKSLISGRPNARSLKWIGKPLNLGGVAGSLANLMRNETKK